LQNDASCSFPFSNSSHPGDKDSDILPYPAKISRPTSKKDGRQTKFFILTSKEAHDSQIQEAQNKKKLQKEKKRKKNEQKSGLKLLKRN
jgi:hypothetical protein